MSNSEGQDCPPKLPKCATCRFDRGNELRTYCFNPKEEDLCDSDHRFRCSCGQLIPDYSNPNQAILEVPEMVGLAGVMPSNYGTNNLPVPVYQPVANNIQPQFQSDQSNLEATLGQFQDPSFVGNTAPLGA